MPLSPDLAAQNDALEAQYLKEGRPHYKDSNHFIQPVHTDEEWQGIQQQKAQAAAEKQAAKDAKAAAKAAAAQQKQQTGAAIDAARLSGRDFVTSRVDGSPIYTESAESQAAQQAAAAETLRKKSLTDQITKAKALHDYETAQSGQRLLPATAVSKIQKSLKAAQQQAITALTGPVTQQAGQTTGLFFKEPTPEAVQAQERLKALNAPDYHLTPEDLQSLEADPAGKEHAATIQRLQGMLEGHTAAEKAKADHERKIASLTLLRDDPAEFARQESARRQSLSSAALGADLTASAEDLQQKGQQLQEQGQAIQQQLQSHEVALSTLAQQAAQRRAQGIPAGEIVTYLSADGTPEAWPRDLAQQREVLTARQQAARVSLQPQIDAYEAARSQYDQLAQAHNEGVKIAREKQLQAAQATITALRQDPATEGAAQSLEDLHTEHKARLADLHAAYGDSPPEDQVQQLHHDLATRQQSILESARKTAQARDDDTRAATFVRRRTLRDTEEFMRLQQQDSPITAPVGSEEWNQQVRTQQQQASEFTAAKEAEHMRKAGLDPENPAHRTLVQDAEARDFSGVSNFHLPDGQPLSAADRAYSRTLSDGSVVVHPRFIQNAQRYAQAVQFADATPEAKARAIAALPRLQLAQAAAMLPMLKAMPQASIPGVPTFEKWQKATHPTGSEAEQARDYLQAMEKRGFWSKLTDTSVRGILAGLADVGTQSAGALAALTGHQGLSEWAADTSQATQNFLAPLQAEGAHSYLTAEIAHQATRLAGPVASTLLLTRGLGGGLGIASALSGVQTAGAQYADTYNQLRQEGLTHDQAWRRTAPYALASGLASALITKAGGKIGAEAFLKSPAEIAKSSIGTTAQSWWKNAISNIPLLSEGQKGSLSKLAGGVAKATTHPITTNALGEVAEELPDELFSQISSYFATEKHPTHEGLSKVIGTFLADSPAFLGSIMLMGGAGGAHEAWQEHKATTASNRVPSTNDMGSPPGSENGSETTANNSQPPQTTANAALQPAAWAALEDLHLTHPHLTPEQQDHIQRRAATALSIAQGGSLEDVEESDLRASGWTHQDAKGRTLPPGQYHRLKDYTGPNVLDITQDGTPTLAPSYLQSLHHELPAVAQAITSAGDPTRPPAPTRPRSEDSAVAPPPATAADTPAPPSGSGSETTANNSQPPQTTANAAESSTQVPTTRGSIARFLQERGMPHAEAAHASGAIMAHPDMAGKDFDWFYREPVHRATILHSLGITGSQNSKDAASNPLRYQGEGISRSPSGNSGSETTANNRQPSQTTANGRAAALTHAQARLDDSIPGTPEHTAALTALENLQRQPAGSETTANNSESPQTTADGGAAALSPQEIKHQLAAREITDAAATRSLLAHLATTGQPIPHTLKDITEALMSHLGWTNYTRAVGAAHTVLHPVPALASSHRRVPETSGTSSEAPAKESTAAESSAVVKNSLTTAPRTANRVPKTSGSETTANNSQPPQTTANAASGGLRAAPSPLRQHSAYSREKLRILSLIHDPARKAWARDFFQAFEDSFAKRHALYDAIATGLTARRLLHGGMTSVQVIGGRITRLIDFDALFHNFDYLAAPQAALAATGLEEDIHAAAFRLAQEKPGKYGPAALLHQWHSLPESLRTLVTTAYQATAQTAESDVGTPARISGNGSETTASHRKPSPTTANGGSAAPASSSYQLMHEFLRMLVQDRHFAAQITETVDPHSSLLQWVKDFLRDLSSTLRRLMGGLPAPQRSHLQEMAAEIAEQLAVYEGRSSTPEAQQAQATMAYLRSTATEQGWEFAKSLASHPGSLAALQDATPKRRPLLIHLASRAENDVGTPAPISGNGSETIANNSQPPQTTANAAAGSFLGGYDRRAAMQEALDRAEAEIHALHLDSASDIGQGRLRARLRQQQIAATRAQFFLRDNAARELQQAYEDGRGDVAKAAAILRVLTGDLGSRRPAAGWRTLGLADQRALALLGIGVDQSSPADGGGYLYTLSRLKHALLMAEFTLAGTPEHQLALQDLDYVQSQTTQWQTSPDPAAPAYVERDHVFIRQSALADLALTYPATAAAIPPSESEPSRRQRLGLPSSDNPALSSETRSAKEDRPRSQDSAPPPEVGSGLPSFAVVGGGSQTSPEGNAPEKSADIPVRSDSETIANNRKQPQTTANAAPGSSLSFAIPLSRRGQVRRSTFPDADSLAAFQFRLDADTASSTRSTPAQVRSAQQRGLALLARFMEESTLSSQELEQRLLAYHTAVVQQAESASPFGTFTPPSFTSFALGTTPASDSSLPPPLGGDILSALQQRGIRRLGPPDASDGWAWYRQLQADAARSRLKNTEAQRLARAGDITDPKALLAWLDSHLVSRTSGRSIDEAAAELSTPSATEEGSPDQDQLHAVDSGYALGRAIVEALLARHQARQSTVADPAHQAEAAATTSQQDFLTYATGTPGQPFTAAQLAQDLAPEDEIRIGSEWFTVQESDASSGTLTLESPRFGSVTVFGDTALHLTAGPNHLRIGRPQPVPARAPLPEALLHALPPGTQRDFLRPSPLETTLTPLPPGAAATPAETAQMDSDLHASIQAGDALDQSSQHIADSDLEDDLAAAADDYLEGTMLSASSRGWIPEKYPRVIPRDFFNESKVLTLFGRLAAFQTQGSLPPSFKLQGTIKTPALDETGEMFIHGIHASYNGDPVQIAMPYNAGKEHRFPLLFTSESADVWSEPVFNQDGSLSEEFKTAFPGTGSKTSELASKLIPQGKFLGQMGGVGIWHVDRRLSPDFHMEVEPPENGFRLKKIGGKITSQGLVATFAGQPIDFFLDTKSEDLMFAFNGETLPVYEKGTRNPSQDFKDLFWFNSVQPVPQSLSASSRTPLNLSRAFAPTAPSKALQGLFKAELKSSAGGGDSQNFTADPSQTQPKTTAGAPSLGSAPATSRGAAVYFPPTATPQLLLRAYAAASVGQSSQLLPIRRVFEEAHKIQPSLTPEAFLQAVKTADDSGQVLLEPFDTPSQLAAAGPFIVRNAAGVPSISMAVLPSETSGETTANNSQPPPTTANAALAASPRTPHPLALPLAHDTLPPDEQLRSPAHILASLFPGAAADRAAFYSGADARADQAQRGKPRPSVGGRPADAALLLDWAQKNHRLVPPQIFQLSADPADIEAGGEHLVIPSWENDRLYKFTKPGQFGAQALDAPAYLERLALSNRLFGDSIRFEGFTRFPGDQDWRAVISQPFRPAADPARPDTPMPEILSWLSSHGWHAFEGYHLHPIHGLQLWDIQTPGNVISTPDGPFPVDLQLEPADPARLSRLRQSIQQGPRPSVFAAPRLPALENPTRPPTPTLSSEARSAQENRPRSKNSASLPEVDSGSQTIANNRKPPQTTANASASSPARIAAAAAQTDTSPTPAQKEAGNYAKGKVSFHGLRLSIENPRGSIRSGTDASGKPWSVTMPHHYGYILGTEGRDGDHVDFFLGPHPDSQFVLIVNQRKISSGRFDEHKVMLGFRTPAEAARAYLAAYTPGWKGLQSAVPTTLPALKEWLFHHDTTQPATPAQLAAATPNPPQSQSSALHAAPREKTSGTSVKPPQTTANAPQEPSTTANGGGAARAVGALAFPTLIGAGLGSTVAGPVGALAGAAAANVISATAAPLGRAVVSGAEKSLEAVARIMSFTGLQRPFATLGSAPLDRRVSAAIHRLTDKPVSSAKTAALAWLDQPEGLAPKARALVDQTLPTALIPREWLAIKHEMDRKSAFGAELSNDLIRALDAKDKPRVSDLAYPPQFIADPRHRTQLFDAMEGRLPMASLPPEMQALAGRLRELLRTTGQELVRQGIMHPDTFEELQSSGWMPRYTEDDAKALGGSFLAQFKLGIQDLRQQRSTAWHVVDTTRKDATGQYLTVNQDAGGGRRRWRFSDAAQRDAFYSDFIRHQALELLQERHGNAKEVQTMMATLDSQQRREIRAQIKMLTRADLDTPQKLSPALAGMVRSAIELQKSKYLKVNPFEPPKLIKDPVYAVARYVLSQTHNAATMELLKKTAATPEWVSETDVQGFTPIPDNPRFGPLAGKFVKTDIARQLLDLVQSPSAALSFYDSILRRWKSAKLVWNPASHIRDAVGNTLFAYLAGNSLWNPANAPHYKAAIALLRGDPATVGTARLTYADLIQHGVLGGDAYSSLVKDRLRGLLPDARTLEQTSDVPSFLSRLMTGFEEKLHSTGAAASELRRLPDDFYKTAAFIQHLSHLQESQPPSADLFPQAAEHVRKWFPYYDRLGQSALLRGSARVVNPFLSFFRESTRIGLLAAHERPLALGTALAFPMLVSALSAMLLGLSHRDEEEVQKDLAGKGKLWFSSLHPFSMLLPFRNSEGRVQQWDISSVMPFADLLGQKVVPLEEKENSFQTLVRQLFSAGPVLGTAWAWGTNRDAFSGRHIVENDMSTPEMARAYLGHLATTLLPPLAPDVAAGYGIGQGGPLAQSGRVQANKTLQTYDPLQTFLRAVVGLNVKSAEPSIYRQAEDFRAAQGYDAQPDFDYGTTASSRLKRALVQELAQPQPNLRALKNLATRAAQMGIPLGTEKDIAKALRIIDPAQIIAGSKKLGLSAEDARARFRQSLPPASRANYESTLQLYHHILTRAPSLLRQAQSLP